MSAPCIEGLGRGCDLDGGCPWCSRDIAQRADGRLCRHHDMHGDLCVGTGRVPVPHVITVELAGVLL